MRCKVAAQAYTVFGYGGKQVRDRIHSADLVAEFASFHTAPRASAVHSIGGCGQVNCHGVERVLREIHERNGELWRERR
jgi:CDP-paratose 2-epimerase